MNLALAQIEVEPARVDRNVERAVGAIAECADRGAELVVLPELFATGYFAFENYSRTAESIGGSIHERIRSAAEDASVSVLAGTIVEDLEQSAKAGHRVPAESGFANTAVLFDGDGRNRLVYRKHHLFGYDSRESGLLTPGETLETVDVGGFSVGVATCYDLRFPELFRELAAAGVTLTLVPSAWPYPRVEHWRLLPRARAVENQAFVAAANGVGTFEETSLLGRSTVYDPWGTTVGGVGDEEGTLVVDIDPARVDRIRSEFPVLADRR